MTSRGARLSGANFAVSTGHSSANPHHRISSEEEMRTSVRNAGQGRQSTNVSEPLLPDWQLFNKKLYCFIFENVSLTMMIS